MTTAQASILNSVRSRTARKKPSPSDSAAVLRDIGDEDLRDLMHSVTETTERLHATHLTLHREVARLQRELSEANAALRRSQSLAALGEMAAGIAHEVRNPLGSIQLYVQMLASDLNGKPELEALCEKISRAVTGLDAIVRDVLLFARDTTIRPQKISSRELLDHAIASCDSLLADDLVKVTCALDECSVINVDITLITQAVGNVIRNAIEAMRERNIEKPELRVESSHRHVRSTDGYTQYCVAISVQDNGPGIPAEVLSRVFNPFFTTRQTGTGLGLAIVHRIVDAHNGHINITNIASGGTRVEILLPDDSNGTKSRTNQTEIQV